MAAQPCTASALRVPYVFFSFYYLFSLQKSRCDHVQRARLVCHIFFIFIFIFLFLFFLQEWRRDNVRLVRRVCDTVGPGAPLNGAFPEVPVSWESHMGVERPVQVCVCVCLCVCVCVCVGQCRC